MQKKTLSKKRLRSMVREAYGMTLAWDHSVRSLGEDFLTLLTYHLGDEGVQKITGEMERSLGSNNENKEGCAP